MFFISYRGDSEGSILGSNIYSDLHYCNNDNEKVFTPFFAPACIPRGEDFTKIIAEVLANVKCVILIQSEDYFVNCGNDDDMVFFELITALKHPGISFCPYYFS